MSSTISMISLGSIVIPAAAPWRMNASAGSPRARTRVGSVRARGPRDGGACGRVVLVEHGCFAGCELHVIGNEAAVEVVDANLAVEVTASTCAPTSRWGPASRRAIVDSLSTFGPPRPIRGRSIGNSRSNARSSTRRTSGIAQISARRRQHRQVVGVGQHQIGLGVADQVLDDAFRLRVSWMAEVRDEPVVRRTGRSPASDHHVRNGAALQTPPKRQSTNSVLRRVDETASSQLSNAVPVGTRRSGVGC